MYKTSFSLPHCTHFSGEKLGEWTNTCHLVLSWRLSESPMANVAEATQLGNGQWILVLCFLHVTTALFNYSQWKVNAGEVNTQVFCLLHANLIPVVLNCATVTVLTQNVCRLSSPAVWWTIRELLEFQGQIPRVVASFSKQKIKILENSIVFLDFTYFAYF